MKRFFKRALPCVLALSLALLSGCAMAQQGDAPEALGEMEVTFLNVGKADAIVLRTQNSCVVIDTGKNKAGQTVVSFLREKGVEKIDLLTITHFDKDHVGGADTVLKEMPVSQVYVPDYASDSKQYLQFIQALEETNTPCDVLAENISFELDGAQYAIDVPNQSYYGEDEENDFSLVTSVQYGQRRLLFAGDAENPRLGELLEEEIGQYDFLKVPHHGREEKLTAAFLQMVRPRYAVITSDEENMEDWTVMEALERVGCQVFLTRLGEVTLATDGDKLILSQPAPQ